MRLWQRLKYLLPSQRRAEESDMQEELESLRAMAGPQELGNLTLAAENVREVWGWRRLEEVAKDLNYAFRMLRRNRAFTAVAVLSLALGIGSTTAVFSVIDGLMLKRLPVEDPAQLMMINVLRGEQPPGGFSYPVFEQVRVRSRSFSGIFAHGEPSNSRMWETTPDEFELVRLDSVSANYFSVLGVNAVLGRTFSQDPEASEVEAVISHGFWQRRYGSDPKVIGKTVRFTGGPAKIIGVTSRGFAGVEVGRITDIWLPLEKVTSAQRKSNPRTLWLGIMGRLKPAVSPDEARAEMDSIFRQMNAEKPLSDPTAYFRFGEERIDLLPGGTGWTPLRQRFSEQLYILMGITVFLLLLACANVSGLLLARGSSRRKEIIVRLAIGGGRFRVIRQLLTESAALAGLGAVGGIGVAYWSTTLLLSYLPQEAASSLNAGIDIRALLFTTGISILSTALFGILPAFQTTRLNIGPWLKDQAGNEGRWQPRLMLNRLNVVFQVAVCLILLVGAGLFLRTLQNLRTLNAGFDRENVLQFSIDPGTGFSRPQLISLHQQVLARLEGLPGVISATFSGNGMLATAMRTGGFQIHGYTRAPGENVTANFLFVAPKFFETVGLPLKMGRGISAADENTRVVVINETLANRYFSGRSPIGQYLRRGNQGDFEIVGVAQDAKYLSLREQTPAAVYAPFSAEASPINAFSLRMTGDRTALASALRQITKEINPRILVSDLRTMGEVADATIQQERLTAQIAAVCSMLALLLACIGLFGVLSYNVTRRTKEIGIHMALGARPGQVVGAVMRETTVIVGIGLVLGLAGVFGATRFVASLLFGVSTTDALTIVIAVLALIMAAAIAGYFPAKRASRVDPLVALRYE